MVFVNKNLGYCSKIGNKWLFVRDFKMKITSNEIQVMKIVS